MRDAVVGALRGARCWPTVVATAVLALGLLVPAARAAIATAPADAAQAAQALAGPGVEVSNAEFTGAPVALGTFTGGAAAVGFDTGVILSTGDVALATGPNDTTSAGMSNGTPGDPDLPGSQDAAALRFDFRPERDTASFTYVFGSEEYDEFVGSGFNDVFTFLVNGVNCALVPGTSDEVSINTVNRGSNASSYRDNRLDDPDLGAESVPGPFDTQLDGLTVPLPCDSMVMPGALNTIKLVIADRGDSSLDSDVFLEAGSFRAAVPAPAPEPPPPPPAPSPPPAAPPAPELLQTTLRVQPDPPVAGRAFVVVATVVNRGAATVQGAQLELAAAGGALPATGALPAGCRKAGTTVVCDLPALPSGGSAERRITFVADETATLDLTARVRTAASATPIAGGAARVRVAAVPATAAGVQLPPPRFRRTANVLRAGGRVLVRAPGTRRFVLVRGGRQIPMGSIVDARRGRVALVTEQSPGGTLLKGTFFQGAFKVSQATTGETTADLALGNFRRCGAGAATRRAAQAPGSRPRGRRVRRVWAVSRGGHRTRGRSSAASVRGTQWLTTDYCGGTLTTVRAGTVSVRDLGLGRTVAVRAGRQYFARRR